ncbi:MAG: hypothetical protein ACTHU0_04555 [Kofleriaceae bacterium]
MKYPVLLLLVLAGCPKEREERPAQAYAVESQGGAGQADHAPAAKREKKLRFATGDRALTLSGQNGGGSAAAPALPRASDVLPADKVGDKDALLVSGDGFRFQIPAGFKSVEHPSQRAYRGSIKAASGDAELTLWAASEPFTGNLKALVERERAAIGTAGGKAALDGAVLLEIAGKSSNQHAHRLVAEQAGRVDMRILAVHDGRAFVFHCEAPGAWAQVSADCAVRGATFQVAPPAP